MLLLRAITAAVLKVAGVVIGPPMNPGTECTAHVVRLSDERAFRAACDTAVELPDGVYHAWLERPHEITPALTLLEVPAYGNKRIATPFIPSGEVRLAPDSPFERVRLFDVEMRDASSLAFERLADGVTRMPAGRTVAAAVDDRGAVIALSRPTVVGTREPAVVNPDVPRSGGDVIAFLERPLDARGEVALSLETAAGGRRPDVIRDATDRVLAIWYGVESPRARIVAESKTLELAPVDLVLPPRRVTEVRATLQRLPSIHVRVATPDPGVAAKVGGKLLLSVRREHETEELRRIEIDRAGGVYHFEALPRDVYSVALLLPDGEVETEVDVTSGTDADVELALEPIVISGTVWHGKEPAQAKISFRLSRGRANAVTNADGRYEIVLWQPRMYEVQTTILGGGAPPLLDFVRFTESTIFDVEVPRTDVRVRVIGANGGAPIEGASVAVLNTWGGASARREHRQLQNVLTDASGIARVAPLRAGSANIHVVARGYVPAEPRQIDITEETTTVIEIQLRPEDAGKQRVVRLADGTPAAGAELLVADPASPRSVLWRGAAGIDGIVAIPDDLVGLPVVIRHPMAAGAVQIIRDDRAEWKLSVPAPPLRIQVERWNAWPEPAEITLWIDGVEVRGSALAFLASTSASVPANRIWTAHNLPTASLRIAATLHGGAVPRETRGAMATTVSFPWPLDIRIRVTE